MKKPQQYEVSLYIRIIRIPLRSIPSLNTKKPYFKIILGLNILISIESLLLNYTIKIDASISPGLS